MHEINKCKTAVLITGNPIYLNSQRFKTKAVAFYGEITDLLKSRGYCVKEDAGLDYTVPSDADLWIAHSRGMDRLRWAPPATVVVRIDDYLPHDHLQANGEPSLKHFIVNDSLRRAILQL